VGDSLYVLGGANRSGFVASIERCNVEEGKYARVGKLQTECILSSTAIVGENILVFGGLRGVCFFSHTKSVQCFDTVTHTTTEICSLPQGQGGYTKSVGCEKAIFTISPWGYLLKLTQLQDGSSESHKVVLVHKIPQFYENSPRFYFCAVAGEDGKIIVLGGQGGSSVFNDFMVISSETGEVVEKLTMPFAVNGAVAGRLVVRREHLRNSL
jgi:hypothetical protein